MNYRHQFHAGNFADAMKHALLAGLVRGLQRKEKGMLMLDTHAGRGAYRLEDAARGDSRARAPEHPGGIGRLWNATGLPALLADYVALVREFDARSGRAPSGGPRTYPGSPWILRLVARKQDRLALFERHPEEARALKADFARVSRVLVQEGDGYVALRATLPPPERRALVLIDPPFEDQREWTLLAEAFAEGLRRFPSGTFAVWYPLTERAQSESFLAGLPAIPLPPAFSVEIVVGRELPGMRGCGLLIVNPPWKFAEQAALAAGALAELLTQGPGAASTLRWLVPE